MKFDFRWHFMRDALWMLSYRASNFKFSIMIANSRLHLRWLEWRPDKGGQTGYREYSQAQMRWSSWSCYSNLLISLHRWYPNCSQDSDTKDWLFPVASLWIFLTIFHPLNSVQLSTLLWCEWWGCQAEASGFPFPYNIERSIVRIVILKKSKF